MTCLGKMGIAGTSPSLAGPLLPWSSPRGLQKPSSCIQHRVKNRDGNNSQRPHTPSPKAGWNHFYPIPDNDLSKLSPCCPSPLLPQGIIEKFPCPQMDHSCAASAHLSLARQQQEVVRCFFPVFQLPSAIPSLVQCLWRTARSRAVRKITPCSYSLITAFSV